VLCSVGGGPPKCGPSPFDRAADYAVRVKMVFCHARGDVAVVHLREPESNLTLCERVAADDLTGRYRLGCVECRERQKTRLKERIHETVEAA
jgi:hypothetical protein